MSRTYLEAPPGVTRDTVLLQCGEWLREADVVTGLVNNFFLVKLKNPAEFPEVQRRVKELTGWTIFKQGPVRMG